MIELSFPRFRSNGVTKRSLDVRKRAQCRAAPAALLAKTGGCWHLDEMVARIVGETVYLWRVVDQRRSVSIGVEILALLYSAG
jgi:transposase-like protein